MSGADHPVFAMMILGGRREPFLPACLESVREAVDLVVVDVNGDCPGNLVDLESSALAREGRLVYEAHPFTGFSAARNYALGMLPPGPGWVLKLDADEVHYAEGLRLLTRVLLPSLPSGVGVVDVYSVQFMQSFRYFTGVDRRHDFLLRRTPDLGYEGEVHERTVGLEGRRVAVPYMFGHYGYVRHPGEVLEKWKQYADLGDPSYPREELERAVGEGYLDEESDRCMPWPGRHPEAVLPLRRDLEEAPTQVSRFDRLMEGRPARRSLAWKQRLRILWRMVPLWPGLAPEGRKALARMVGLLPL